MKISRTIPRVARQVIVFTAALLVIGSTLLVSCKKSESLAEREATIFLLACPTGPFVCFDNCFQSNDTNGNGTIEGSEEFGNNICNAQCNTQCSLSYLFFILADE